MARGASPSVTLAATAYRASSLNWDGLRASSTHQTPECWLVLGSRQVTTTTTPAPSCCASTHWASATMASTLVVTTMTTASPGVACAYQPPLPLPRSSAGPPWATPPAPPWAASGAMAPLVTMFSTSVCLAKARRKSVTPTTADPSRATVSVRPRLISSPCVFSGVRRRLVALPSTACWTRTPFSSRYGHWRPTPTTLTSSSATTTSSTTSTMASMPSTA
mmetsp:Transcript_51701/g.95685  ORF Transcript_51701/g.95685 Transcript_51701/m.95685 type:complete len:220 (+) Transcript_51701:68-727(+)